MNLNLEVNGLTKRYKDSDFYLDNVSFLVPKGAIVGFIGENGAGKTTTINCILGTLIKDGGRMRKLMCKCKTASITAFALVLAVLFVCW